MHEAALTLLEDQGIRVLLREARDLYANAGAKVDDDQMVTIGRDIIAQAIDIAPSTFTLEARNPMRSLRVDRETIHFGPGAGCPNVTDLERGRRPGTLADFREATKLQQAFDVCAVLGPSAEAQDIPVHTRHLHTTAAQMTLSDKIPFLYSRGTGQAEDAFEIIRLAHGIDKAQFQDKICCFTVINTNSPRQLDKPMAQGLIDFARANQVSVVTPFCLAGAMAPITLAGALTLSHAEALAGIALAQIARPGAPMIYGAFSSNVDLKSGAPVFGTPEHMRANFGAGQLARHVNLPWRSGAGTAANSADAQGAAQTAMALWGTVHAGANFVFHAAGWLEGGLTFGYEKYINDLDMLHTLCLAMQPVSASADEIGLDNIASVAPAATSSMRRKPWNATAKRSTSHCFGKALISANGRMQGSEPPSKGQRRSGRMCWRISKTRPWKQRAARPSKTLSPSAKPRAVRRSWIRSKPHAGAQTELRMVQR